LKVEVARSDKFKALVGAIALAIAVAVLVPPAVEAATQKIKGTVTAKVKDTRGGNINSKSIADQGLFDAPGSSGALDVRTFGAGNGFLAGANCLAPGSGNVAVVPGGSVITGIIITGTDANVDVQANALGGGVPVILQFETTPDNANVAFSLGNGLKATGQIRFTCNGADGQVAIIGQSN
jgi:hypothetical protein